MSRRKKKKSIFRSTFYRVYFALVIVALVAIVCGTFWLRGLLADYEAAQPIYVAERVARLFENADYDQIYALDTAAARISGGDRDFYVQSLTRLSQDGRVEWSEVFSGSENERRYAVKLNGERFATFTLVPSGQTDRRGNRLWTLGSVTVNVALEEATPAPTPEPTPAPQTYSCRVTAPEGYAVYADGTPLTEDNAQTAGKGLFEEGFLPESVKNPTLIDYTFDWTNPDPDIAVVDANGGRFPAQKVADREMTWEYRLPGDEALKAQFGEVVLSLGKQVAKYISGDAGKKSIKKACAKNSPADDIFDNLGNMYTTPHTGISFRNESASEFQNLSDDCFTCRVTFDAVLATKEGEKVYPTAYTFCVIRQGDSWKLWNMLSY